MIIQTVKSSNTHLDAHTRNYPNWRRTNEPKGLPISFTIDRLFLSV